MSIYDYKEEKTDNSHIWNKNDSLLDKIRHKYYDIVDYKWRPHQIFNRLKCWGWYRYTTIKPRFLSHTWCDKTELLIHINFEILCNFIEKECSPGYVDWNYDDIHKNAMSEMMELYNWWIINNKTRDERYILFDKDYDDLYKVLYELCKESGGITSHVPLYKDNKIYAYEWKSEKKNQEIYRDYVLAMGNLEVMHNEFINSQLKRIIDLRSFLWT